MLKRERPSFRGTACGLPGPSFGCWPGEWRETWGQLRKSFKFYAKESDLYFEDKGHLSKDFFFFFFLALLGLSCHMWDLLAAACGI